VVGWQAASRRRERAGSSKAISASWLASAQGATMAGGTPKQRVCCYNGACVNDLLVSASCQGGF